MACRITRNHTKNYSRFYSTYMRRLIRPRQAQNVELMLVFCWSSVVAWWANIMPALVQRLVFAGNVFFMLIAGQG